MSILADAMAMLNSMKQSVSQISLVHYELTSTTAPNGDTGEREKATMSARVRAGGVKKEMSHLCSMKAL